MSSKLDELNLSTEEVDRFSKAMSDPAFRDLLREYAEEISNPAHHAEQEAYLRQVEAEAAKGGGASGAAIGIPKGSRLLAPQPVLCIKVLVSPGARRKASVSAPASSPASGKLFINLCTVDALDEASTKDAEGSKPGQHFSLPYALSTARTCTDAKGGESRAYDFVFSASSWARWQTNPRVALLFQDMAVDAVEEAEGFDHGKGIDRQSKVVLRNVTFKGGKPPPRLFKLSEQQLKEAEQKEKEEAAAKQKANNKQAASSTPSLSSSSSSASASASSSTGSASSDPRACPKYTLVHRGYFQLAMDTQLDSEMQASISANRPKELVLKVDMPLVERVADVSVDQSARQLLLSSPHYLLLLPLPYPIQDDAGKASWSSKTRVLTIVMPLAPPDESEIAAARKVREPLEQKRAQQAEEQRRQEEEEDRQQEREKAEKEAKEKEEQEKARRIAEKKREQEERRAEQIAEERQRISSPSAAPVLSPSSSPSSSLAPPVLKSALTPSCSPRLGPEKSVRFTLDPSQVAGVIPERDGPNGPKPVSLSKPLEPAPHIKKGHRRKHVPGADGPESWGGVGREPSAELRQSYPEEHPDAAPLSPSFPKKGAAKGSQPTAPSSSLWPPYTYSQSGVGVTLVVKVKSIVADSVRLHFRDLPSHADSSAMDARQAVDLTFLAKEPRSKGASQRYRLFLPLAFPILAAKCSFQLGASNLILNLLKRDAGVEWAHLYDFSLLGEFDTDGTPLSSPLARPMSPARAAALAGQGIQFMEELSLGETANGNTDTNSTLESAVQPASASAAAASPSASSPPAVVLEPIAPSASAMFHPFVTANATHADAVHMDANAHVQASNNNALLFQLD